MNSIINKKDIKRNSRDFRTIANRVLTSDFDVFDMNLKRLINYINNNELIMEFLNSCIFDDDGFEIEKDVKDVSTGYGEYIFDSFIDETKEISYIYQILKQITENNISYRGYVIPYSSSKQYQDKVKGFCDKFVLPFVNAIDGNFERICIEMGYNEDEQYNNITINGGQVILAKDHANITATQNNYNEMDDIVNEIKNSIENIQNKELESEIIDNVEGLQEEIKTTQKKGKIKAFMGALENILPKVGTTIEVSAAITQLITFAQLFIK